MDANEFNQYWEVPFEWNEEQVNWLRSRPDSIKKLILQFPPDCKLQGIRELITPSRTTTTAVLRSWMEDGRITVADPIQGMAGVCEPSWVKVLAYREGCTPEDVKRILEAK